MDFTYETLFTPRENETLEERVQREQYIKDFQENYFGFYNNAFFEETGVRFNNLSFKEQGQLLLFYKSASDEEKKRVLGFIRQSKEGGFRAFLSLERGREMGETILAIGETLPHEAAGRVFAKYSEIVFVTEDVRQYLCETFDGVGKNSEVMVDGVVENLLCKGKDLLVRFAHEAKETKTKGMPIETRDILHQLAHIKTDILLFASAFREAIKSDRSLTFDAIRDTTMESRCAVTLTNEERGEMRRIFLENRKSVYPAQLLTDSLKDIDKALQSKRAQFHLLKHKGELVGFLRFERLPNGHLYLGSLNVRPETRGSSLGTAFVGALLDQYRAGTIEAVVYDKNTASQKLLRRLGFEITGKIENYHGTGETFFTMERPAQEAEVEQEALELAAM